MLLQAVVKFAGLYIPEQESSGLPEEPADKLTGRGREKVLL